MVYLLSLLLDQHSTKIRTAKITNCMKVKVLNKYCNMIFEDRIKFE